MVLGLFKSVLSFAEVTWYRMRSLGHGWVRNEF